MLSGSCKMVPFFVVAAMLLTQVYGNGFYDPIKNMCQRFWHQSIIKNNVLYIDGGMQSFIGVNSSGSQAGNISMGYNQHLIVIPLNESWTLGTSWNTSNITEVVVPKVAASGIDGAVPNLVLGTLFEGSPNDDNIWLYGGTTNWWNMSFPGFQNPTSDYYSLWGYNTKNETWTEHSVYPDVQWRPSAGAHAEATDLGLGFYFNGEIDSGSSQETQVLNTTDILLEGMIVINTTDLTARNVSTAAVSGTLPRSRGSLTYIPGIGTKGILVAIGGTYKPASELDNVEQNNFVDMNEIDIFDVASLYDTNTSAPATAWYRQQTSGETPDNRASFCAVMAAAPDNSSYNIYVISGNNQASNIFYDDVYILSLPSFTWTKVYGEGYWFRYGHTCHRASNRQLVTVGGAMSWGFYSSCDPETHGIAVYDMTQLTWNDNYTVYDEAYEVPGSLIQTIGGQPSGGATVLSPVNGYSDLNLATLMGNPSAYNNPNSNASTTTTTTTTPHPSTSHTGAIVGGVIGGLAALALLALLTFLYLRHTNKRTRARSAAAAAEAERDAQRRPMMAQTGSSFDGSGAPLDSTVSPRSELQTDAGPYGGGYQHAQELGTKGATAWGQAELDAKQEAVQLPADEGRDGAVELPAANARVYELPGHP